MGGGNRCDGGENESISAGVADTIRENERIRVGAMGDAGLGSLSTTVAFRPS
jgi:hypothetical protein